jgi:glycosyltransferase involved in cell wall biosynthesis
MRIGVNCFLLQPHIGGLKQYFLTLFDELLAHDRDNEYVFFWYPHNEGELAKLRSERWREHAIQLNYDQREMLAYLDRIDVYFCPFGALYPRPLPLPTAMTMVDIQEVFFPEFFTPDDRYNRDVHFASSTRMADRVITISEFSKATLVEHHRLRPSKVVVAHLSADECFYHAESVAAPPAAALPEQYIMFPANFWKHKNHDRLLQALRLLREERGLRVDAVFTGFEQANGYPLTARAQDYGIADQVHPLGYVTREELAYLYLHARALVFPSLFEGFGIPLVEAMATGCPVVASNTTSIPEVVGDAAVLFEPTAPSAIAEAVAQVWCDDSLRLRMVERGRRRAEAFSAARTAQAHLTAFAEAKVAYSRRRFQWNQHVYQHYYSTRVALRWRRRLLRRLGERLGKRLFPAHS